jgi:MFS family permease
VLRLPGALKFVPPAFVARFPIPMLGIGITLLVQTLYRSYQIAGIVTAVYTVVQAVCQPLVGRWIDRSGQSRVGYRLIAGFALGAGALAALASLRAPWPWLLPAAALTGAASFPIGSMTRTRWAALVPNAGYLTTAFSLEAMLDDIAFMFGPSLATLLATAVHPTAGLLTAIVFLLVGGLGFLARRDTEPPPEPSPARLEPEPSLLRRSGVPWICGAFFVMGLGFGANNITTVAVSDHLGWKGAAGLVLACGSLASMTGALFYGARRWVAPLARRFTICLLLQAASCALFLLAGNWTMLVVANLVSGLAVSPSFINGNALVQRLVPAHQLTEGLTWIGTALGVGIAAGSATAGRLIDTFGPRSGFGLMAGAGAVSLIIALGSARTLARHAEAR